MHYTHGFTNKQQKQEEETYYIGSCLVLWLEASADTLQSTTWGIIVRQLIVQCGRVQGGRGAGVVGQGEAPQGDLGSIGSNTKEAKDGGGECAHVYTFFLQYGDRPRLLGT